MFATNTEVKREESNKTSLSPPVSDYQPPVFFAVCCRIDVAFPHLLPSFTEHSQGPTAVGKVLHEYNKLPPNRRLLNGQVMDDKDLYDDERKKTNDEYIVDDDKVDEHEANAHGLEEVAAP